MKLFSHLLIMVSIFCSSCNSPPDYPRQAHSAVIAKFLNNGEDVYYRLVQNRKLSESEVERIFATKNDGALHYLAANASIDSSLIRDFSKSYSLAIRSGLASNTAVDIDTLMNLRTPGKFTVVNDYLVRNPRISESTILKMYRAGEIGRVSPLLNPNCPEEIMMDVIKIGRESEMIILRQRKSIPTSIRGLL
jgi:hypothetical protein